MFSRVIVLKLVCVVIGLVALCATARGDYILGAGDVAATYSDGAEFAVDLDHVVTLSAGTYKASLFSYQFAAGKTGTVQAAVVKAGADVQHYVPLALGSNLTDLSTAAFASHAFGTVSAGSDTFTLASATTVYAAFSYRDGTSSPIQWRDAFGHSAVGTPNGTVPVIGTPMTTGYSNLTRTYDFSVTVAPVPEPASLVLLTTGLIGLLCYAWRKRK